MDFAALGHSVYDFELTWRIGWECDLAVAPDAGHFLVVARAERVEPAMRSLVEIFLAFRNLVEGNVRRRQEFLDVDAGDLFKCQSVGVSVNRPANQQIAADFAARRIGKRFIDPELVETRPAFQVEVVEQIDDDIARRRDEIVVPGDTVAVYGHRAARTGQESGRKTDVFHALPRRAGNVSAIAFVTIWDVRSVVQHRHAIANEFDVAEFFGCDARHQAINGLSFSLLRKLKL